MSVYARCRVTERARARYIVQSSVAILCSIHSVLMLTVQRARARYCNSVFESMGDVEDIDDGVMGVDNNTVDLLDIIGVAGGRQMQSSSLQKLLLLRPLEIDGRRFVVLGKQHKQVVNFVGGRFGMIQAITRKRNDWVANWQKKATEEQRGNVHASKSLKRDLVGMPQTADVDIGGQMVTVTTTKNDNSPLGIEATKANFELLLIEPDPADVNNVRTGQRNVVWHGSTQTLVTAYIDATTLKWRRKSSVKIDMSSANFQERVSEVSIELQRFYEQEHYDGPMNDGQGHSTYDNA